VRTQVFTIGAGLKVTASALGAALIGFAAGLPAATQLLFVASSPLLVGILGTVLLRAMLVGMRPPSHNRTVAMIDHPVAGLREEPGEPSCPQRPGAIS